MNNSSRFGSIRKLVRNSSAGLALFAMATQPCLLLADDSALPSTETQGATVYLTGGIGSDESAAIKDAAKQYSLFLTLAERQRGHDVYLASVPVRIENASGTTVLDVTTDGPFLLVQLEPGNYEVIANHKGVEKKLSVKIGSGAHVRKGLSWEGADLPDPEPANPVSTPRAESPAGNVAMVEQNGVRFISGGIGMPESQAMRAQLEKHALGLTFARQRGGRNEYLAAVQVQILDSMGTTVLDVTTEGPYLLVDLPDGAYTVKATYQGLEKQAHVTVSADQHVTRAMIWPGPAAQASPVGATPASDTDEPAPGEWPGSDDSEPLSSSDAALE